MNKLAKMTAHVAVAAVLAIQTAHSQTYQPVFFVGQTVKDMGATDPGDPDSVCISAENLQRYGSSSDACAMGDAGSCNDAKGLEDSGACGATYHVYVVLAVSQDLIELSPVQDRSKTYWARANDFQTAQ